MKQITSRINPSLHEDIKKMAENKNWSFDYMVYVLLQQAVKEKTRKNKPAKENNS